jgi:hypothetical protein
MIYLEGVGTEIQVQQDLYDTTVGSEMSGKKKKFPPLQALEALRVVRG